MTTDETACLVAVMRRVPDGFPRRAEAASKPEAISASAGRRWRNSVSPASVVDPDRKVAHSALTELPAP